MARFCFTSSLGGKRGSFAWKFKTFIQNVTKFKLMGKVSGALTFIRRLDDVRRLEKETLSKEKEII